MSTMKREPSVDELLSDPMMAQVFVHYRTTADDVRGLMRDVASRRAKARAGEGNEPSEDARSPAE
jgi:hypothetical protein